MIPGTLFRYLMRSYMARFGLILLIVTIGLLLSGSFDTLNRFKSVTFTLPLFISLISMKLPYLLSEIMPMIVFISTLFFLNYLIRTHQLVSIFVTGTSTWRMMLPIAISALIIGMVSTTVMQPIASVLISKYDAQETKLLKKRSNQATFSNSQVMIAEEYYNERRIISVKSVDVTASKLQGITILFIDKENNFISRIDADYAYLNNNRFILHDVKTIDDRINDANLKHDEIKIIDTDISIDRFAKGFTTPDHISFWNLPHIIKRLQEAGMPSSNYLVYYYKQLFKPLMMVAVCFMAFCFINLKQSRVRGMQSLAIGIFVGFIVYLACEICIAILMSQGVNIVLSNLCPIIFIILLSLFTILHLHETG